MSRLLLCWFWCSQTLCAVLQKPKIQPVYMRQYVKITFPKIYHVELSSLQSHISKLKSGPNIFLVPDKPGGNLTDIKHYFIYMHKSNRTKYAAQWFFKYNNTLTMSFKFCYNGNMKLSYFYWQFSTTLHRRLACLQLKLCFILPAFN